MTAITEQNAAAINFALDWKQDDLGCTLDGELVGRADNAFAARCKELGYTALTIRYNQEELQEVGAKLDQLAKEQDLEGLSLMLAPDAVELDVFTGEDKVAGHKLGCSITIEADGSNWIAQASLLFYPEGGEAVINIATGDIE